LSRAYFPLPTSTNFAQSDRVFSEDIKGFLYHLKNRQLLLMFGLGAVLQISFTGMWTFLPFHLIEEPFSLSLQQIAYFYLAYSVGTVGAPIAGWLARRYDVSTLRVIGVITLSIGMFTTLFSSINFMVVGLCIICLGFFISFYLVLLIVLFTSITFNVIVSII